MGLDVKSLCGPVALPEWLDARTLKYGRTPQAPGFGGNPTGKVTIGAAGLSNRLEYETAQTVEACQSSTESQVEVP